MRNLFLLKLPYGASEADDIQDFMGIQVYSAILGDRFCIIAADGDCLLWTDCRALTTQDTVI